MIHLGDSNVHDDFSNIDLVNLNINSLPFNTQPVNIAPQPTPTPVLDMNDILKAINGFKEHMDNMHNKIDAMNNNMDDMKRSMDEQKEQVQHYRRESHLGMDLLRNEIIKRKTVVLMKVF